MDPVLSYTFPVHCSPSLKTVPALPRTSPCQSPRLSTWPSLPMTSPIQKLSAMLNRTLVSPRTLPFQVAPSSFTTCELVVTTSPVHSASAPLFEIVPMLFASTSPVHAPLLTTVPVLVTSPSHVAPSML